MRQRDSQRWRLIGVLAFVALTTVSPTAVGAQQSQERPNAEEAKKAIEQLKSPYCPGFMLETCTSSMAATLRDSIYDLAAEGATSDELVEWMLAGHGEEWRAMPQRSGKGLVAWLIPPLALLAGMGGIALWLRANRTRAESASGPASPGVSDEDREKVAAALREWHASGEEEP
jgi:cytochrome c-type biogenesis protein CcmH/NrfF